ncbi:hypothetical protein C8A00DRAFT_35712 [Chaetomidium leptoderma]|uniref:Copper acquisition factor BIM1-like domain-containing protein n=1 Tax=Chaetomidium leptoderma TaxID=669021 RepID=A0AAN6VHY8_9PEZI|nr:hypothetical protein C8A00DRAFT_35712 [Chaetomidium leptoderma]
MAFPILLLAAASLADAHFGIEYPPMRANTLGSSKNTTYSQWTNPCAGVPGNLTTRPQTPWPLTGGSIKLDMHHPWSYVFINLGLGPDVSNFNYTLTNPFWNETGNGTLCVPQLALPADLPGAVDGAEASLQVVTVGEDGNALYNCADIVFKADAKALGGSDCVSSEGVSFKPVATGQGQGQSSGGGSGDGSANNGSDANNGGGGGGDGKNAGASTRVSLVALSSVVALATVFVFGMSV